MRKATIIKVLFPMREAEDQRWCKTGSPFFRVSPLTQVVLFTSAFLS
jgi:hypothetical protein